MFGRIIVLCGLLNFISAANLPSLIPRCYRDDPELNNCLLKATEIIKPRLKDGIPELGLPSLSPLYVSSIVLEQGTTALNYKVTLTNVEIRGFDDYKFTEFSYNPNTLEFRGTCLFDKLITDTDADIDGKILGLHVHGSGKYKAVLGASSGSLNVTGKLVERKGKEYYEPLTVKAMIYVSNHTSTFTGLFGGNEQLTQALNKILDENSKELLHEVLPVIEQVAEELLFNVMKSITIPYNELFPLSS